MSDSRNQPPVPSSWSNTDDRLDSWKEIASYLQRTLATVRRWEKKEGLPVHRHLHDKRGTVYAYRSEIDAWLANRSRVLENDSPGWFRSFSENRKTAVGVAGGVTLILLVGLVAWMDIGSSPNPEGLAVELTRVGEAQRALTDSLRRADLSPNSFDYTHQAAYQLLLNGDLARAKTYWGRALDLMTPEDVERYTNTAIQLMWFPAFEALMHADPETALREANRLLETLRSFERRGFFNYEPTGAFYLTLGKIGLAKEWFEETDNVDSRRHYFLAAIAYIEEDHEAMIRHLEQFLRSVKSLRRTRGVVSEPSRTRRTRDPVPVRNVVLLLARGGLLSEAAELSSGRRIAPGRSDVQREEIERRLDIQRGVLALSRGNRIEGIRILENALASFGPWDNSASVYFMGSEILAQAWREQGNSDEAVQVLKEALEKKSRLLVEQSLLTGPLWLRLQAQLGQLYREMGRTADALKIESDLRLRLALADPDHPILRQLDRTKELALREPTSN